jgi:hypothetical protein
MNKYRNNAKFAGAMFLLAMAGSLIGGTLIESGGNYNSTIIGIVLELINALSVIGIVAALYVPLKEYYPSITTGYMGIRIIESITCVMAALVPAVSLYSNGDIVMLTVVRSIITEYAVPTFFGIGAVLLYTMLFRSRLVPRYISVWGLAASIGIMLVMLVSVTAIKPVLGLPIILNEIYLGIYLIAKGFSRGKNNDK